MPEPLSEQEIRELVRDVSRDTQFVDRNTEISRRRGYLRGESRVSVPGITEAESGTEGGGLQAQFHSPKIRRDANAYKRVIRNAPASISIAAQSDKPNAIKNAQAMQNFARRWYTYWLGKGAFDGALFNMAGVHRGVVHLKLNNDVMPMVPQPEKGESPDAYAERAKDVLKDFASGERADLIEPESILPETVFWTPDRSIKFMKANVPLNPLARIYAQAGAGGYAKNTDGSGKRIRVDDKGRVDVTSLVGGVEENAPKPSRSTVMLYVVESAEYIYHLLLSEASDEGKYKDYLLGCYTNPFGVACFFDVDADRTGEPDALWEVTPLCDGLYESEPLINLFGTLIMDAGVKAVQAQRELKPVAGADAVEERKRLTAQQVMVRHLRGGYRLPPPGYEITAPQDNLPADVISAFALVREDSERNGFPPVLANPTELKATSGYDRAKAQDTVSSALDHPLENWGSAVAGMLNAVFTCIGSLPLKEGVTLRSLHPSSKIGAVPQSVQDNITIKPDMIEDVDTSVIFDSTTTYTRIALQEEGQKQLGLGLMHKTEYIRDVRGVDDPERWYDEKAYAEITDLAESEALKDATEVFVTIKGLTGDQAIDASGLRPLLDAIAAGQGMVQDPMDPAATAGAPSIPTGPDSAMPLEPSPNPEAELGRTGANAYP